MKYVSQEELNQRVKDSKKKEDNIMVTFPTGTKQRISKYYDNYSKYIREVILNDLERKEAEEKNKLGEGESLPLGKS